MAALLVVQGVDAQTPPAPAPAPSPAPAAEPAPPAVAPAADPGATPQRVEIRGQGTSDTEERRQSTAGRIVMGRDEIERYGETNVSDLIRRLPGVSTGGAPGRGRGGAPRLRGLGNNATQVLVNGERLPSGFSLDSLPPEMLERIELMRAPTAETGARALAGTINIVTREGYRKRVNELRAGIASESSHHSPNLSWTRNDSIGESFTYTTTLSWLLRNLERPSVTSTVLEDVATGDVVTSYEDRTVSHPRGPRFNINTRLQWHLDEDSDFIFTPSLAYERTSSHAQGVRQTFVGTPEFTGRHTDGDSRTSTARLAAQYNELFDNGTRVDLRSSIGQTERRGADEREETDDIGRVVRVFEESARWRDNRWRASARVTTSIGDDHGVSAGAEFEHEKRKELRTTLENGVVPPFADDFGENLDASAQRRALYVQDEWQITPQWAVNAGLRWEAIDTRGSAFDNTPIRNRSSVTTPLLHTVYKLAPGSRDQVRLSLTRSYRAPTLQQLIARPNLSSNNSLTSPDRFGNPELRPETAQGVDLAFERYLADGGLLSASIFQRRIKDVIRNDITVNTATGRVESRPLNLSRATARGIELEAKFRADKLVAAAPRVNLSINAAVYDSKVDGIAGPDNRLDQQARAIVTFGADYRFSQWPLAVGANLNWSPPVTTRISATQVVTESAKRSGDVYAAWTFNPTYRLRMTAGNVVPRDYVTTNTVQSATQRQSTRQSETTHVTLGATLEVKF